MIVYVTVKLDLIKLDLMCTVNYNFHHADNAGIKWAGRRSSRGGLEKSEGREGESLVPFRELCYVQIYLH